MLRRTTVGLVAAAAVAAASTVAGAAAALPAVAAARSASDDPASDQEIVQVRLSTASLLAYWFIFSVYCTHRVELAASPDRTT